MSDAMQEVKAYYDSQIAAAQALEKQSWQANHPGENYEQHLAELATRREEAARQRMGLHNAQAKAIADREAMVREAMEAVPGVGLDAARAVLRERIAEHQHATEAVTEAAAHEARAKVRADELAEQLAQYADLDEQITVHTVGAIKHGNADAGLPYHLVAAQRDRSRCCDLVDAAQKAHVRLAAELGAAKAEAGKTRVAVSQAAGVVLAAHGDCLAAELIAIEKQAADLRSSLMALSSVSVQSTNGNGWSPISLGLRATEVIRQHKVSLNVEQRRAWQGQLDALMLDAEHDPDAALG